MVTKLGLLIALWAAVLATALDVGDYVFVEFNPKTYFPYLVKNNATEPAPIVYLMTIRDVVAQELATNTSMYIPRGVYLAIPRHLFSQRPPAVPRDVKGRVVDVEVEGLGVVRLLLASNSTEVPNAHAVYAYLDVEERGGRLYYREKPLDVRKPKNIRGRTRGMAKIAARQVTPRRCTALSTRPAPPYIAGPATSLTQPPQLRLGTSP